MNLISSAAVRTAPIIVDKAPYRGKSGSGRQSPIPASEALARRSSGAIPWSIEFCYLGRLNAQA